MKKILKILLISLIGMMSAFLILILSLVAWNLVSGYRSVAYHNACIRKAQAETTKIEIEYSTYSHTPFFEPKTVVFTDQEKIHDLLNHLRLLQKPRLEQVIRGYGFAVAITIHTRTSIYKIDYDYINCLSLIDHPGGGRFKYIQMEPETCAELNRYFASLGFSKEGSGYP